MRHVYAVTPIHVDEHELARRRRRYASLAPRDLDVHLVDAGTAAPSGLDTGEDLEASETVVAAALAGPEAARYDVRIPDCVLDPGVPANPSHGAPTGMLLLTMTELLRAGHRVAAVTRNGVIGAELDRKVRDYGFGGSFLGVTVLDLDLGSIADSDRWNAAMADALRELGERGASAVINGCSAVDVAPASGGGPLVVDAAATALRLLGSGGTDA